jgi:SEC-C motif-containing protein
MNCPCCSGKEYSKCCEPFHKGIFQAPSAEALMRSRYAAFALPNGKYLWETTSPLMRKFHPEKEYQNWAEANQWTKLEILNLPAIDQVEFKAYFTDEEGEKQIHHELSKFERLDGKWFYVSGEFWDE